MLRSALTGPALAALLLCAACDQRTSNSGGNAPADNQSTDNGTRASPRPASYDDEDDTMVEAENELNQAIAPNAPVNGQELARGVNAGAVANPETTFKNAQVKTQRGEAIGEVRAVVINKDGKADAVNVEVGGFLNVGERVVAINANKFTYLKDKNVLVATMSKADIEKLPAVPGNGG